MGIIHSLFHPFKKTFKNESNIYTAIQERFCKNGQLLYIGSLLCYAYQNYPEKVALIAGDRSVSYRELFIRASLFGEILQEHGIGARDRVILFCENSFDFYVAYWAAWQVGAILVPVNIYLHEKELAYIIQDCQPKLMMISSLYKDIFAKLEREKVLSFVPKFIVIQDHVDWLVPVNNIDHYQAQALTSDEVCLLLYTSGTTGVPKGVMLSSKNIMTNALQVYTRFNLCGLSHGERIFCVLPLFHVFAQNLCVWTPVITSSAVIVVQKIDRKLILEGLKQKPTLFIGVPALYGLLCLMKTAPLETVKFFVSGADMLPDKIRAAFGMIYGRKIASGYGLTEAAPVIAINYENVEKKTTVVGDVLIGIDCCIKDDQGNQVSFGQTGTLWVHGNNVMLGYYNAHEQTAKVLQNGWLNTGDLATLSEDGFLAINGREKDVIIHKGFNIYPAEIENVLMIHPCVTKVAVIGQQEEISGQVPVAYLAVKNQSEKLEQELRDLCNNNLASYKIPRKFICLDDLPMNATGKIDKKRLQIL